MKAGFYVVTLMVTQIRGKIRELLSLLRLRTVYVRRSNPPCLTERSIVVCYRSFFVLRSIRTVYFYGIWHCSTTSI